ncbi:lipase-like PAD4 isoform X2 [Rosa rugosa]|uniref:lipase-like PAD4 isoform X2 n=1 Tax=Rosa rugosa TaxID=74645 RepID=UPI002B40A595|nr:lipase-like PAD4 isoform X2 [Rosa rugosa]
MEAEASPFESSELVASFLASTPLLSESWRLCSLANAAAPLGFVSERIGDVGYFAFSACSTQMITEGSEYYSTCRNLVPLDSAGAGDGDGSFSVLTKSSNSSINGEEDEGAVMVHAELLNLFLFFRSSQAFKEMLALIEGSKSIVITGHSIGGTTASLCALWLLCYLQSVSSNRSVLCITFGSPLLGNESLHRAILRERWGGNFCHVVSKYDIMPRLLFAPLESCTRQLHLLLQYWQMSMLASSPGNFGQYFPVLQLGEEEKAHLFSFVSHYNLLVSSVAQEEAREEKANSLYWPFGNYMFCSQEGAICVENAASVIKMMHLMFTTGNPSCCINDHLKYGDYIGKISSQFLNKKSFLQGEVIPESSYEAGVALALQSSGISKQEPAARPAEDCLKKARGMRHMRTPSLNAANLAIRLSKVNPYRAQIEWYMASCDKSDEQLGYYFKQRGSSKRDHKVNMNRLLLAGFWNDVLRMLENNELPHDFHKRPKWINTSQFYKLLVEPLDIAEYYRSGMHRIKGHYLKHGRERRFEIFDRWWREREVDPEENTSMRSRFAGLTQDSCFWAKVEEATEWLANVRSESDARKLALLWENINKFERYATRLVDDKEVSKDVVAKNSSYSKWVEELRELKSQMQQIHPQFPRFRDGA